MDSAGSQEIEIEEEIDWPSTPVPPAPILRPRGQSTCSWSTRSQSTRSWSTHSQLTHSQLTPAPHQAVEPYDTPSGETPPPTQGTRGRPLTEEEKLVIIQGCNELGDDWLKGSAKETFWRAVSSSLYRETERTYSWKSCRDYMKAAVKARQQDLKKKETGRGHDPETDLVRALDQWIDILDQRLELDKQDKAAVEARKADAALDDEMRTQLTERRGKTYARNPILLSNEASPSTGDATSDSEHPQQRQHIKQKSSQQVIAEAVSQMSIAMVESVKSGPEDAKELSSTVKNMETRLEKVEETVIKVEETVAETNDLLKQLLSLRRT
jgi:hypothetical protein